MVLCDFFVLVVTLLKINSEIQDPTITTNVPQSINPPLSLLCLGTICGNKSEDFNTN
jgi:hypothetical protein